MLLSPVFTGLLLVAALCLGRSVAAPAARNNSAAAAPAPPGRGCGRPAVPPNLSCATTDVPGAPGIIGGCAAKPYSWPWQALVEVAHDGTTCGGVVIAQQWVLTSATCLYLSELRPDWIQVKAGDFKWTDNDESGEVVSGIDQLILHPQYDQDTFKNDLALIHLVASLSYSEHIQPVCLPDSSDNLRLRPDVQLWVTGWGEDTTASEVYPSSLQQTWLQYLSASQCLNDFPASRARLTADADDTRFCAARNDSVGPCFADYGDPLVKLEADGSWYQYGVGCFADVCEDGKLPSIFTSVADYCGWIASTTGNAAQCVHPPPPPPPSPQPPAQ